jgi:protein-S-isoprenylcysteine O-methyltransferase Ste14
MFSRNDIMSLDCIDTLIRWLGGLIAYVILAILLAGIWRGMHRSTGATAGKYAGWLRSLPFYLLATILFLGLGLLLWQPLPFELSAQVHIIVLSAGVLLYFPGLTLVLWGRLALGKMYFVSTSQAVQLFAGHELVIHGLFAIVRHPMYLGLILAGLGGLLIYQTWTMVVFSLLALFVLRRARAEEKLLAAAFGKQWQDYCDRVPAFLPRLWSKNAS